MVFSYPYQNQTVHDFKWLLLGHPDTFARKICLSFLNKYPNGQQKYEWPASFN